MLNCDCCRSDRVIGFRAITGDLLESAYKGTHRQSFPPWIDGFSGGDDLQFKLCLNCGKVQGEFPKAEPDFDME